MVFHVFVYIDGLPSWEREGLPALFAVCNVNLLILWIVDEIGVGEIPTLRAILIEKLKC